MSASTPCWASALRVSSGYSELMRSRPDWAASSARELTGDSLATASTTVAGFEVFLE